VTIGWEAAGATDVGRLRRGNEDSFHLDAARGIFLVADGMGGHAAGEVASELATRVVSQTLVESLAPDADGPAVEAALRKAVLLAHTRIIHCCEEDPRTRGMGTTLTCCVLTSDGGCHVAHIGDSRLYRFRDAHLEQLTHDHTWVQHEIDSGRLSPEAADNHPLSHILTRVLSDDVTPATDITRVEVAAGDLLMICSDGLYNMLPAADLAGILGRGTDLADVVGTLIDAANAAGGSDNVTVIAIRVRES
jgi:serine/threonine protein phosphatase PrpC